MGLEFFGGFFRVIELGDLVLFNKRCLFGECGLFVLGF